MVTFIELIKGNNEGSRYKIEAGLTIGRADADILVNDPKVSGTHARFEVDGKGQFVLIDLDSSNGIHISGRRVKKVALLPGVIFEVGRTQFLVIHLEEENASDFPRIMTWRDRLREDLPALRGSAPQSNIQSFNPAIRLFFTQGIQADHEIVLGYGPRLAGSTSLDIELFDIDAPPAAFEISPAPGGALIKVLAPSKVTINNKTKEADVLRDGDLISFGSTVIKVSYL